MGKWAKNLFGKARFSSIGIVVAGTAGPEFEKKVLSLFDKVISSKDSVYHAHLVRKGGREYPIVFNVYGAPAMVDVLTEMHDGGCRIVIFVGLAYGGFEKNLNVGTIVISDKAYHFEGIFHSLHPDRKFNVPDNELMERLENLFRKNKVSYIKGTNISVPAVSFQLPHANKKYQAIKPLSLEMELASCYSRARDIGIRAVGSLIISDNRSSSILNKKKVLYEAKLNVLETIIDNLRYLNLPKLKVEKEFNIDEHLASVIENPEDITNIYRKRRTK